MGGMPHYTTRFVFLSSLFFFAEGYAGNSKSTRTLEALSCKRCNSGPGEGKSVLVKKVFAFVYAGQCWQANARRG